MRFAFGDSCRLFNGHIVQGRSSNTYSAAVASYDRPMHTEVAGISTDVHLKCAYPLHFTHSWRVAVHHNLIYSRVTEIENRHYPGNSLMRFSVYGGDIHIHDNILTEGCHWGITVRPKSGTVRDIEIDHNDIQHHQQYVNGYAISPGPSADVHHNRITSAGRGVHLTGEGTLFHHNYIDTRGHQHLSDLPAGTRPFHHRLIELHGVKLEGRKARHCRVYGNYVRIRQLLPRDGGDARGIHHLHAMGVRSPHAAEHRLLRSQWDERGLRQHLHRHHRLPPGAPWRLWRHRPMGHRHHAHRYASRPV